MTEPPAGWTSPGAEPPADGPGAPAGDGPPAYGTPPGYGPPPAYGTPPGYGPPPGYGAPPGYGTTPPGPPPGYGTQPGWGATPYGAPAGLRPGVVPLRPLTVGELLDGAVSVIRRYPKPALGISAVVALATTLVNLVFLLSVDLSGTAADMRDKGSNDTGFSTGFGIGGGSGSGLPGGLVGSLAGLVLTGALVVVVGKAVLGRPTTFGEVWQEVRPRLLRLLGLALLTGVLAVLPAALGGGVLALSLAAAGGAGAILGVPALLVGIVGSVYLYTRFSLAPAVLVLEKAGIRTALSRSGSLVKGSWWRVFGILLLTSIISSVVSAVLVTPLAVVGGLTAFTSNASTSSVALLLVLVQVGSGLASFLVAPFSSGVRALLYVDRRMRAEGLDLTLQAAAAQA